MAKIVRLKREFEFDPGEVGWTRVHEFDNVLFKLLDSMGLIGEVVNIVGDNSSSLIRVTKKPMIDMPQEPKKVGRPQSIPSVFKGLSQHKVNPRERDFNKGKLLTRKGYLKK